jgi:hypothetical protein
MPAPGMDLNILLLRVPEETHIRPKVVSHQPLSSVPGQVEGTWHFRTAFLLPGAEWVDRMRKFHRRPRELEGGSRIISLWGAGWRIPGEATVRSNEEGCCVWYHC